MRGISLPAAQLYVIAIENILRRGGGQSNQTHTKSIFQYNERATEDPRPRMEHRGASIGAGNQALFSFLAS